ncbi:cytochrome P450 [Mycena capillaripes]|nr:cytochrome P450 [Mycena capillaripes]
MSCPKAMPSVLQALLVITALWVARWLWMLLAARKILNNIPGPSPHSLLTGHFVKLYSPDGWDFHHELGEKYGGVVRVGGLLGEQSLYIFDPKALHQIMVKNQDIFEETCVTIQGSRVFFGEGLVSTLGQQHKRQRKMLNPVFSPAHLRQMVPIFTGVAKRVRTTLESKVRRGPQEVDVLMWTSRLALELVGQAGLGYSFDPLVDDEIPLYIQSIEKFQLTISKLALAVIFILPWAVNIGSPKFRRWIINITPWKNLHDARDIFDTLYATAVRIYNLKKAALEAGDEAVSAQIAQGKDIISILMKDNNNVSSTERLSEDEVIGQLKYVLISSDLLAHGAHLAAHWYSPRRTVGRSLYASIETYQLRATSSALSRTLHILAQHPEAQEKFRQEIRAANAHQEGVDLSYDKLLSLEYLDAICRETLRLYPPVSFITRTCRKDVALTISTPITTADGSTTTEIPIPAATDIFVSIISSNRNPAIWGPDSLEWKPERWLSPLPKSVAEAKIPGIYANLMTFNAGGRACIGFKFSQLEMKVVLCLLVERFKFSLSDKDITWQMSSIAVPSVDGIKPQLPLKIELAD